MPGSPGLRRAALCVGLAVAVTSGCSVASPAERVAGGGGEGISVQAAFYPLEWMAAQVGGAGVDVASLTKAGAEPHDLEINPSDVAALEQADVVVYLAGFQPAVDEAVRDLDPSKVFDASRTVDLDLGPAPLESGESPSEEAGNDPHFWLDPSRLAAVGSAFATFLGRVDPDRAAGFAGNSVRWARALADLDEEFESGLASCANRDLVTSHSAFGYLARRYGLQQFAVSGLSPEDEPSPADLAVVSDFVEEHGVRSIYVETLSNSAVAEVVARDTGVSVAVLDPIEGLTDTSQGDDYLEVMRANLATIRKGQPCP